MRISVEINPAVKTELCRQAAERCLDVEAYAAYLLENAAHSGVGPKRLNHEQLNRTLQELTQFSNKIPSLPDSAFTRESLYRDHG